jgi:hypothetical protein
MSAEATLAGEHNQKSPSDQHVLRMAVAWQHPEERGVSPVGLLEYDGTVHRFRYLRVAADLQGFRPFIGFPDLSKCYRSRDLFPLFAQRVMSPRRPDYSEYLQSLDLSDGATTWEKLARTEGKLASDTIQLVPEPTVREDGSTLGRFLVAGVRWQLKDAVERERVLEAIQAGDRLRLVDEPTNEKNPRAILTTTNADLAVGWVPDMLLDYVHTVKDHGAHDVTVVHRNGPNAPSHMRLLVELKGMVELDYVPFSGSRWSTYTP